MTNKAWIIVAASAALLAACSIQKAPIPNSAVQNFIVDNQLESLDRISTRDQDGWVALNDRYALYNGRRQSYLLEFRRECKALTNTYDKAPDLRRDQRSLHARVDTLSGCAISHIYPITKDQRSGLKSLGDAPDS